MLYTDCQSGRTTAIMHHVSFAQITCQISVCCMFRQLNACSPVPELSHLKRIHSYRSQDPGL